MPKTTSPVYLRLRGAIDEATERLALRAALSASHLLGLATGTHLRKLRAQSDPLAELQARLEEAEMRARLARETAEILGARFSKVPERHRPYFTPAQRFRILEMRSLLAWSAQEAARVFVVCPNTILNWDKAADPEKHGVGSTVKPTPPIRRAADVVRSTIQSMTRLGLGGQDLMARILARAGWTVSARSVGRYRKEKPLPVPPPPESGEPVRARRPVAARFPPPPLDDGHQPRQAVPGVGSVHGRRLRRLLPRAPRSRGLPDQAGREGHGPPAPQRGPGLRPSTSSPTRAASLRPSNSDRP